MTQRRLDVPGVNRQTLSHSEVFRVSGTLPTTLPAIDYRSRPLSDMAASSAMKMDINRENQLK